MSSRLCGTGLPVQPFMASPPPVSYLRGNPNLSGYASIRVIRRGQAPGGALGERRAKRTAGRFEEKRRLAASIRVKSYFRVCALAGVPCGRGVRAAFLCRPRSRTDLRRPDCSSCSSRRRGRITLIAAASSMFLMCAA